PRVALPEGELVVNSSQGGGSKDTWVLGSSAHRRPPVVVAERPASVPQTTAENTDPNPNGLRVQVRQQQQARRASGTPTTAQEAPTC
ncbi:MAG: circularly permuted type 2 ATP-grasp protein, partial [Cellulomonas sp.]|nr:circularly permuted type 2 ATP-grasp protein [Cellulomonas sp.]